MSRSDGRALLHDPTSSFTTLYADAILLVLEQRCGDGAIYRWLCRRPLRDSLAAADLDPARPQATADLETLLVDTLLRVGPTRIVAIARPRTRHGGPSATFDRSLLLPEYHVGMVAALGLCTRGLSRMLCLGVGGGALCMHLRERYPACTLVGVERDERAIFLAQRYFGLRVGSRLQLHATCAVEYLRRRRPRARRFDAIFLDASTPTADADAMCAPPPSLRCAAVTRQLRAAVGEGGVLVVNALGAVRGVRTLRAQLGAAFEVVHAIGCGEGNVVLVACAAQRNRVTAGVARLQPARRRVWLRACATLELSVS